LRWLLVAGDEHDRAAAGNQRVEQRHHRRGRGRVEVAGRFITHDDRWIVGQRPGDRGPLLLSTRDLRWQLVGVISEADPGQKLPCDGGALLALVHPAQRQVEATSPRKAQLT
jgi:hypothetical protein